MNPYLLFILITLIGSCFLDITIDLINLNHLKTRLPAEFKKLYSPQKYQQSQRYLKVNTIFSVIHTSIVLPLTLTFLLLGGFNTFDRFARYLAWLCFPFLDLSANQVIPGLLFAGLILLLNALIDLPFSIYDTFVIEKNFGFNQTTPFTFIKDLLLNTLLTLIIATPIFGLLIHLFSRSYTHIWLLAWLIYTLIQLFLMFIYPAFILPLFNRFTPLPDSPLKQKIHAFAAAHKFRLQGIYTMDGSRRSTKSNAFFTGFGPYRRIVLFDTLIKQHSDDELVAILAHEIGHYKHQHICQMLAIHTLVSLLMFFFFNQLINNPLLFAAFSMDHISTYASLIFIGFIFSPLSEFISVFILALSRHHEYQADRFAVTSFGQPQTFINALKKLSVHNLSNLEPHPLKVYLDYSHPPILHRIKAIRALTPTPPQKKPATLHS